MLFGFYKKYRQEILGGLFCLSLGILSGYMVKKGDSAWYLNLVKPKFNPPSFVFAPVWTTLYIMIGIAFGKMCKSRNTKLQILFLTQFILNLAWSPLFFYYQRIDLALIDLVAIWLCACILMFHVKQNQALLFLLIPYFLCITFAGILNFSIYVMN